jgi:hypothetical protein
MSRFSSSPTSPFTIALRTAGSTRFNDALNAGKIVTEFIDHIVISPGILSGASGLSLVAGSYVVERAAYDKWDDDEHNDDRGLRPSDHVPVSAVFTY